MLCLAFFFLLRRTEMASLSKDKFRLFALKACDVATLNETNRVTRDASRATSGHIRLRGSKTNQAGYVTMRMLRCSGHHLLCPVLGALLLIRVREDVLMDMPVATYPARSGAISSVSAKRIGKDHWRGPSRI